MKIPSLAGIRQQTLRVVLDYPVELFFVSLGVFAAWNSIQHSYEDERFIALILCALIGLPASLAVTLSTKYRRLNAGFWIIGYSIIFLILFLFYNTVAGGIKENDMWRFVLLNAAAHLFVACAGFLGKGSVNGFWQFNKTLFLRFITSTIFNGVLYLGLAGALAALAALFNFNVRDYWFARLFIVIVGYFHTIFFLAGIPADQSVLEEEKTYPLVLKVFTQFVLVPLVSIYLLILLAYEIKIVLQWRLPNGWVSNLILAYGVAGILSILLVYPIKHLQGNTWIKYFSRWFYLLLLPLLGLIFIAIGIRINTYGFTPARLIVLCLAIWLLAMAIRYIFKPDADIRIIPISLAISGFLLALLIFPLSERSQRNRLLTLLNKNQLLKNGKTVPVADGVKISFADRKNLSSTIHYLLQNHGQESLEPWFTLDTMDKNLWKYNGEMKVMNSLGLTYVEEYQMNDDQKQASDLYLSFNRQGNAISIEGFQNLVLFDHSSYNDTTLEWRTHADTNGTLTLYHFDKKMNIAIRPVELWEKLKNKHLDKGLNSFLAPEMSIDVSDSAYQYRFIFNSLGNSGADPTALFYNGYLLIKPRY